MTVSSARGRVDPGIGLRPYAAQALAVIGLLAPLGAVLTLHRVAVAAEPDLVARWPLVLVGASTLLAGALLVHHRRRARRWRTPIRTVAVAAGVGTVHLWQFADDALGVGGSVLLAGYAVYLVGAGLGYAAPRAFPEQPPAPLVVAGFEVRVPLRGMDRGLYIDDVLELDVRTRTVDLQRYLRASDVTVEPGWLGAPHPLVEDADVRAMHGPAVRIVDAADRRQWIVPVDDPRAVVRAIEVAARRRRPVPHLPRGSTWRRISGRPRRSSSAGCLGPVAILVLAGLGIKLAITEGDPTLLLGSLAYLSFLVIPVVLLLIVFRPRRSGPAPTPGHHRRRPPDPPPARAVVEPDDWRPMTR